MLNHERKRPPRAQVKKVLLSTARLLLRGDEYTVPLPEFDTLKRKPNRN